MGFGLWVLSFAFVLSANASASEVDCLNFEKVETSTCANYQYDKIVAHFMDDYRQEQTTIIHRIYDRRTGDLIHSEYDLDIVCSDQFLCSDSTVAVQQAYWALLQSIKMNKVYIWQEQVCDPRESSCCDYTHCTIIYGENVPVNESTHTNKAKPQGAFLRKYLTQAESASETDHNIAETSSIMSEAARDMQAQKHNSTIASFETIRMTQNTSLVVHLVPNRAPYEDNVPLNGSISGSVANFQHNNGATFNADLFYFMLRYFDSRNFPSCTTETDCNSDGFCRFEMTCRRPQ